MLGCQKRFSFSEILHLKQFMNVLSNEILLQQTFYKISFDFVFARKNKSTARK